MPNLAVARPFGERHLGHELWSYPMGQPSELSLRTVDERALARCKRRQLLAQLPRRGAAEAGADFAGIDESARLVIHADQQGPDSFARALRIGEAADDELLLCHALRLHPSRTATG